MHLPLDGYNGLRHILDISWLKFASIKLLYAESINVSDCSLSLSDEKLSWLVSRGWQYFGPEMWPFRFISNVPVWRSSLHSFLLNHWEWFEVKYKKWLHSSHFWHLIWQPSTSTVLVLVMIEFGKSVPVSLAFSEKHGWLVCSLRVGFDVSDVT